MCVLRRSSAEAQDYPQARLVHTSVVWVEDCV